MNLIRRFLRRLENEPLPEERARFARLTDQEFDAARAAHLKRRERPQESLNIGILLVIGALGVPICLVKGMIGGDFVFLGAAAFWLVVACMSYSYLANAAGYWRDHSAIKFEEVRRHGKASFG